MRHGFLLIDKPVGPTSHDIVDKVRKRLHERKVGHLGTLDPLASGLLVLAVGAKALKVIEFYSDLSKEYDASIHFGAVSSTYDKEGVIERVTLKPGQSAPDQVKIQNAIADRFTGKVQQTPPGYSAVKVGGERAYRKMRQGRGVDLPSREVEIESCKINSYEFPMLELHVTCGSGTYIRSLAHDLGEMLYCGGYLEALRRTKVGDWSVKDSVVPSIVDWMNVLPLKEVLTSFPRFDLTEEQAEDLKNGRDIKGEVEKNTIGWFDGLPIAVLEQKKAAIHARKVL